MSAPPNILAGTRGTFVPDAGAPVRGVVLVSHADGRIVLEMLAPGPGSPMMQAAYWDEFRTWIQTTHPDLWARWKAGPGAYAMQLEEVK